MKSPLACLSAVPITSSLHTQILQVGGSTFGEHQRGEAVPHTSVIAAPSHPSAERRTGPGFVPVSLREGDMS